MLGADCAVVELLIAHNPDPDSSLPLLLRVPLGGAELVFATKGAWPRETALYCHPLPAHAWPPDPQIVERVPLRSCNPALHARGSADGRAREQRSQIVFTRGRGRQMVFWQSPRTRRQARPHVRLPTARAAGIAELEIVVDSRERYGYRFADKPVHTVRRALGCGDYAVCTGPPTPAPRSAAVERKSLPDLVTSLSTGRLRFALGELATLPRAAIVVEQRYSQIFNLDRIRPATVADGLAELQIRWPEIPIVFCETRALAEEWTYRYLAAAHAWADAEPAAVDRLGHDPHDAHPDATAAAPAAPAPSTAQVRAWARAHGITVPDRGRLRPEVHQAWHTAHQHTADQPHCHDLPERDPRS